MRHARHARLGLWLALAGCAPTPNPPLSDGVPSVSSPIAVSPDGATLWVVNPDAASVTSLDVTTLTASQPFAVGSEPWAVAVTASGTVVVMNRQGGSLTVLDAGKRSDIVVGPELGGLALSPSGNLAYVSVSSADEVAVIDLATGLVIERLPTGRYPWTVAVTDDGDAADSDETIVVTHRFARLRPGAVEGANDGKEAWVTIMPIGGAGTAFGADSPAGGAAAVGTAREAIILPFAFGYPNVVEGLALVGHAVWVGHLLNAPDLPATFSQTVSAAVSSLPLLAPAGSAAAGAGAPTGVRLHLNDTAFSTPVNAPRAIALTRDGKAAYVVLAGSNVLMGIDLADPAGPRLIGFWPTGDNPRGVTLSADGMRAFVMNYLSRDVSVLDLTDTVGRPEVERVPVTPETLDAISLQGKRLFNRASDPRLSRLGWLSCASCHPDGGSDGTTWLMPDGPRQSMPLWNLAGTAPFHASATRDELQDVEGDIETLMGGVGLAPDSALRLLGPTNSQGSSDLDALARFVLEEIRVPAASQGELGAVEEGRLLFERSGCTSCHGGVNWTLSSLPGEVGTLAPNGELEVEQTLRDVGTYSPGADALGQHGFDVPTLLGLHASAPYLHDGSAPTLAAVLADPSHTGVALTASQRDALAAFLASIDSTTPSMLP